MSDSIYKRLARIMKRVGAIGKSGKIEFGKTKYNFRTLDDVLNRVQPMFAEEGIFISSKVLESNILQGETKDGEPQFLNTVTMEYTFTADDESSVTATAVGQSAGKDDKGMYKAMSGALKYAICQMLCIPFAQDDPDSHTPDRFKSVVAVTFTQHTRLKRAWVQSLGEDRPKREELEQAFHDFVMAIAQGVVGDPSQVDPLNHRTWTVPLFTACEKDVDTRLRALTAKAETKGA